jgi:hypothetical protein
MDMKCYLVKNREAVSISSVKYIYISEDMGWVLLRSSAAAKKVCLVLDLYAPVNYIISASPIIEGLQHWNPPVVALPLTVTWADGSLSARFLHYVKRKIRAYKICVDQGFPRSGDAHGTFVDPVTK